MLAGAERGARFVFTGEFDPPPSPDEARDAPGQEVTGGVPHEVIDGRGRKQVRPPQRTKSPASLPPTCTGLRVVVGALENLFG